ncbi:hypothetical protein CHS0354_033264 [Potamilus streckersoni]|uniref:Cadherin domain-containing protein n=1 Tax=Potamilus streckersoni TaxID=2493646 RepID=A0AAE0VQ58_9BIVA|nr:hypothetical protein CHS0354_033264 [Potamilus streckersoni]
MTRSIIISANKSRSINITYSITETNPSIKPDKMPVLRTYFGDIKNDTSFSIVLNKSLNLQALEQTVGEAVQTINIDLICGPINKHIRLIINDLNEFDPKLSILGPLNITENTTVGTVVYSLLDKASDEDRPKTSTTFNFGIHPHRVSLDTVDTKARTSYATLQVNVIDVDDQGPEFVYPGCARPCLVPEYTAVTDLSYTGPLNIAPEVIKARDLDTMNHPIVYSFYHDTSGGFFGIDGNDCTIYQVRPASQARWISQRLIIKAAEVQSNQPEALAVLMIRVRERDPALNGTNTIQEKALTEDTVTLMSVIIAVSVLLGIILIASAIIVFLLCYRYRKMVYPVTEKEENQSDKGDEASPDKDPLFTVTPMGRHGILPPLPMKDTGTGTDDAVTGKKRRSGKRAISKELEIYDGTREYEMQAALEFFWSTDKSKIKRSTRSFHTRTDHIVVRDDDIAEE